MAYKHLHSTTRAENSKPSETRWLSHERCLFGYLAIHKGLLALIATLHYLYDTTGDAEPFALVLVLSSFCVVASIAFIVKGT